MASNEEPSRRGRTYGPNNVYDSILHQGDNIYLSNEKPKINCRDELLLKDPFIYRESLKNDKGERASGTCEWIRENEIYRSWLEGDEQRLWICGGPGKGKTMLSIFLTEELERKQHEREDDQDTTLLYFFCTNGNENYNNAIAVLRGLAYQLLSKHPDISTSVSPYFETAKHTENTLSSPETLWMVFKTLLRAPKFGTVYCILDGLDECDEKSIGKLVKQFRDFYSPSDHTGPIAQNLKLAIVSRKINGLEDFPKIRLDPDNDNLINEDIKRFISTAMQELSRRSGYDDDFLKDIENILLRRSNGTFLWIGFVMKELLDMSTRMEVMDVLNALPQGLPALYGRMLLQINSSQRHIISTILKCVTIARRPMTLKELMTAVSLLCNTPIDSTQIMCDRIASCGSILQISSEGQDTCSLVHQSARDYLLWAEVDTDPILEEFRTKGKEAHTSLARICLACIENSDFRHGLLDITDASVLKKLPLLGYATKYWPEHARHADEDLDFSKTPLQKNVIGLLHGASKTNRDTIMGEATKESISNWNPGHSREQTEVDDNVTSAQGDRITNNHKSGNGNISASMVPNRSTLNYSLASTQYRLPTLLKPSWRSNESSQVARTSTAMQDHYLWLPPRLCITFNGKLTDMTKDWSQDEWAHHRRIVIFEKVQNGKDLTINFKTIPSNESQPNSIYISCIWWADKSDYYITFDDIIYLLEQLVFAPNRFTVEEKNRIRRNLEWFHPRIISRAKPSTEELFKIIAAFPHPKAIRLEKDFKVFAWNVLEPALKKIIGKYSSKPNSILPTSPSYIVESEPLVSTSMSGGVEKVSGYGSSIQRDHDKWRGCSLDTATPHDIEPKFNDNKTVYSDLSSLSPDMCGNYVSGFTDPLADIINGLDMDSNS